VARAAAAAARSGAAMLNVHASGGRAMLEAARQAVTGPGSPKLIAVTLLTSLDARALSDLPMAGQPEAIALLLARLAQECGLDGVVCSASDLPAIRGACGPGFLTVVPGIRPAGGDAADQKRVATPSQAAAAGADILVVGRAVTGAKDPDAAIAAIEAEIESAHV
jgi:orotidine-5'-phosphate decarboxylase